MEGHMDPCVLTAAAVARTTWRRCFGVSAPAPVPWRCQMPLCCLLTFVDLKSGWLGPSLSVVLHCCPCSYFRHRDLALQWLFFFKCLKVTNFATFLEADHPTMIWLRSMWVASTWYGCGQVVRVLLRLRGGQFFETFCAKSRSNNVFKIQVGLWAL